MRTILGHPDSPSNFWCIIWLQEIIPYRNITKAPWLFVLRARPEQFMLFGKLLLKLRGGVLCCAGSK